MVRRSIAGALWAVAGFLACFLGALAGLIGTGAGRTLLAGAARAALAGAVAGRVTVGGAGGPLLTGVALDDVVVYGPDSGVVARLPRVEISYRPVELAAGRFVLRDVVLERPYVHLVEHPNGRLNIEDLLRLGLPPRGPARPAPYVALRNARIRGGTVLVSLQARGGPGAWPGHVVSTGTRDGPLVERRFDDLDARVAFARLSSASARERGLRFDLDSLAVDASDPAVRVRDLTGRVVIAGDSLTADLARVRLPGTLAAVRGVVSWPHGALLLGLAVRADSATLGDLRFIDPKFPAGAVLRGSAEVRSHGARLLEVRIDPLALAWRGGTARGRLDALVRSDSGIAALDGTILDATAFPVGFAAPWLDTLPVRGRLTGHTSADGPVGHLTLGVDWSFADSLAPGAAPSTVRGSGAVDLAAGHGLRFDRFRVDTADLLGRTLAALAPGLPARGRLAATGTLSGPVAAGEFTGTLRASAGDTVSVVRGSLRWDGRGASLGLWTDVTVDPLDLRAVDAEVPGLALRGAVAGRIRLAGTLAALDTHVELGSDAAGTIRADGVVSATRDRVEVRDAVVAAHDADLSAWVAGGPPTRLDAVLTGTLARAADAAPEGGVALHVAPSTVVGVPVDTAALWLRFADQRAYLDSLRIDQPGIATAARGFLGWRRPADGTLTVDVSADSLAALDSLVTWLVGDSIPGLGGGRVGGALRASVQFSGALDSLAVTTTGSVEDLRGRGVAVTTGHWRARVASGPDPALSGRVDADHLDAGGVVVNDAELSADGTLGALDWTAHGGLGDLATVSGRGRLERPGPGRVALRVDSLGLDLPRSRWHLADTAAFTQDSAGLALSGFVLARDDGAGRLALAAALPDLGPVRGNAQVDGFPIAGLYALLERDTAGVAGALSATLGLSGTRAAPVATASFALKDASFGEFRTPYLDGTAEYHGRRLTGTARLWRSGQQILTVRGSLPLDLALQPVARRALPDTLSVRATADSVDLAVLEAVTPLVRAVRGTFNADVALGGTWDAPRLSGSVAVDSGGATIPALGVRYEDVTGRFRLAGDTVAVTRLALRGDRGTAQVAGYVRLEGLSRPVLALDITADRFKALEIRGVVSVTATAQLALRGPVFGATLTGQGTVTNGVLYFADLVNKRVVNLDSPDPWIASLIDTSITDLLRRERLGPAFQSVFLDSLRIAGLRLTMGSDVWLRSNEANIQLTGNVTLDKRLRNYLVSGVLQAPRGTYRLAIGPVSREFEVTQGTVRYFGTPDLDAALDIGAKYVVRLPQSERQDQPDLTVLAHIGGTLLVPRLTLSAEQQDLSQTEVISYLLFGQPSVALGSGQGPLARRDAMLVGAVSSVVSGELERTVVSDLGVPLDYFQFRPGEAADPLSGAQLAAGWQIGTKTFLVVNVVNPALCPGSQVSAAPTIGATLQFRISPEWRTEASFEPVNSCATGSGTLQGSARQVGLDLFWETHY